MKKFAIAIAAAALATSAMADITIGTVNGLVTATNGNQLFNVQPGMTLPDGVQFNVPAGGSVNISMPGCSAAVGPGSVAMTLTACQTIQASAGGVGGGAGGGFAGLSTTTLVASGLGLGALGYAIDKNNKTTPTGPSNQ